MQPIIIVTKPGTLVWCVGILPSGADSSLAMDDGVLPRMVPDGSQDEKGRTGQSFYNKTIASTGYIK